MEEWQNPETVAIWLIVLFIFITILVVIIAIIVQINLKRIVRNKMKASRQEIAHQEELLKNSIQIQERERHRIAADLHDDLISQLAAIGLMYQIKHDPEELKALIQSCIRNARNITHDLSPPLLKHTLLPDLIRNKIDPWAKLSDIRIYEDNRYNGDFSDAVKIQFVRIIQELMNNIHKHAEATITKIHLRFTNRYIILKISENGKGFDVSNDNIGLGLKNIEMRVRYLKGKYRITSTKNQGSTALIIIQNTAYEDTPNSHS